MSKEQKEAIALIFILTAIIVSACVMLLIRPRLKEVAENKKILKKITTDINKERNQSRQLLELTSRKEGLEKSINENETGLFGGIIVGDLSRVVNAIVKSRFRNLKLNYLGDHVEILPGGRYNELANELKIKNCDFHQAVRFISTLETSNPGIRVTNIEINTIDRTSTELGKVTVGLEIRMVGMYEGEGIDVDWKPESEILYQPGNQRNPFGRPGAKLVVDAEQAFKDRASSIKVTMNTGDSLWIKDTAQERSGARECLLGRYMPIFRPLKVGLTKIHEDYFIVRRDDGKLFKFIVRQSIETVDGQLYESGTIKEIIELK